MYPLFLGTYKYDAFNTNMKKLSLKICSTVIDGFLSVF